MQKMDKNREQFTFRQAGHIRRYEGVLNPGRGHQLVVTNSRLWIEMRCLLNVLNVTDQINDHQGGNKQGDKTDFCRQVGTDEAHRQHKQDRQYIKAIFNKTHDHTI